MRAWAATLVPKIPGATTPLRLFNTTTGLVESATPGETATMYVCGITPYDATHLGHAATYIAFDLVHRQWLDRGHRVRYVQNVTDVDDPLLARAARDQDDWVLLGSRQTALFREDMAALRVLPPSDFVGAVEAIPEIVEAIGKLMASGAAYRVGDPNYPDIYFDHSAAVHFGAVSSYDDKTMVALFAARGGDPDRHGKRHPLDALLWRLARPDEPCWESEFGAGRPGWHIECAAIALNRLGNGFDVQGGGSDLIFPHHEFSAAHAEAITGEYPFAHHYVHAGMIGLAGQKMSKSKGNLLFVSRLRADRVDPMAIRLALLDGHYRVDREWTPTLLTAAENRLARWRAAVNLPSGPGVYDVIEQVRFHLANDLDTPQALPVIDAWSDAALAHPGSDEDAPALLRLAVDALLGIEL